MNWSQLLGGFLVVATSWAIQPASATQRSKFWVSESHFTNNKCDLDHWPTLTASDFSSKYQNQSPFKSSIDPEALKSLTLLYGKEELLRRAGEETIAWGYTAQYDGEAQLRHRQGMRLKAFVRDMSRGRIQARFSVNNDTRLIFSGSHVIDQIVPGMGPGCPPSSLLVQRSHEPNTETLETLRLPSALSPILENRKLKPTNGKGFDPFMYNDEDELEDDTPLLERTLEGIRKAKVAQEEFNALVANAVSNNVSLPASAWNRAGELFFSLGPTGSGVKFHNHAEGWNLLLYGRKQWFFYPPHRMPPIDYFSLRGVSCCNLLSR